LVASVLIMSNNSSLVRFASASEGGVFQTFVALVTPLPPLVLVSTASLAAATSRMASPCTGSASTGGLDICPGKGSRTPLHPWLSRQAEVQPRPLHRSVSEFGCICELPVRGKFLLQFCGDARLAFSRGVHSGATPELRCLGSILVRESRANSEHTVRTDNVEVTGAPYIQGVPQKLTEGVYLDSQFQ
jgi:hypothetical protein